MCPKRQQELHSESPYCLTDPPACATVIFVGRIAIFAGRPAIRELGILLLAGQLGNLLQQTGWVARIVLILLLFFSLISWALIFQKLRLFARIDRQTDRLLQIFRATKGLPEPRSLGAAGSPLETVYAAGYRELQSQLAGANPHGKVKSVNAIAVGMQLAAAEEVRRVEKWMPWLATTGSVTPFIGLFGTVWGVMDAFAGLGSAGAASLRAVAPGIAEALITTAAGLFTAIPAVVAYNHYLHDIKELATRMDNFAMEVVAQVEKLYG
jgi:biopolymer transport protein TolQ